MLVVSILIAVIISLIYYRKTVPDLSVYSKTFLIFFRIVSVTIILILFFNPILYFKQKISQKPNKVFLMDHSDSTTLPFRSTSKIDFLQEKAEKLKEELEKKGYEIASYDFANGWNGDSYATKLQSTLYQLNQEKRFSDTQDIILFSDGWFQDESISSIEKVNIPIHTFQVQDTTSFVDVRIEKIVHNPTAYVNEENPIEVFVSSTQFDGNATVQLFDNDNKIQEKRITFQDQNMQQVSFSNRFNHSGLFTLKAVIIIDNKNELLQENNSSQSAIHVLKNKKQVLILTDVLTWDSAFFQRAIRYDQRWEVKLLQKVNGMWKNGNNKAILSDFISNSDVVVIMKINNLPFLKDELNLLKNFCNKGGGLFYQGYPESTLLDILPVKGRFIAKDFKSSFSITREGKRYQSLSIDQDLLSKLPPVDYAYVNPNLQAKVLATFHNEEESPAMLYQNFGNGKILMIPFLNFWKWQLQPADNAYHLFINNVVNWISNDLSETFLAKTNQLSYRPGEDVKIILSAFDETLNLRKDVSAKVTISKNDKPVFSDYMISNGEENIITVSDLKTGSYSYVIEDEKTGETTSGTFAITNENQEFYDLGFNQSLLRYISQITFGKNLTDSSVWKDASVKEKISFLEIPLYKKWYIIVLFLISFCTELYFRKRWGLL